MQESVTYRLIKQEGRKEARREIAVNCLREGIAIEIVARATGIGIEQLQQLQPDEASNSSTSSNPAE